MSSRVLLQSGAESLIPSFSLFLISREARINLRPQSPSVWEGGEGGICGGEMEIEGETSGAFSQGTDWASASEEIRTSA